MHPPSTRYLCCALPRTRHCRLGQLPLSRWPDFEIASMRTHSKSDSSDRCLKIRSPHVLLRPPPEARVDGVPKFVRLIAPRGDDLPCDRDVASRDACGLTTSFGILGWPLRSSNPGIQQSSDPRNLRSCKSRRFITGQDACGTYHRAKVPCSLVRHWMLPAGMRDCSASHFLRNLLPGRFRPW